ncbi:saccharopine dehydrogenase C-terminal domain-containing protein [Streptomyces sp. DSM 44915]|uniref:Saccharopine dehydrogenase C-terminal domain-containing protein n=1 Tax=Streptomyces chisholmiae TaxID=3075540 RepID=A0ABU2JU34_9ACTN|nr:saccharopine dehydrogenase C-terminal domain-containing protein [Streptomyces sp. DSM 44915]MDT0268501.1 saccharopine dehydrogenase C-terminal domain-containing protein [Streptomyces sp. DSM 44915]
MADLIPPTGRVHWVGTGRSTGSGLGLVCDGASTVLWGRTVDRAESCLRRLDLLGRAEPRAFTPAALAGELAPGDVLVSMLPAGEHPALAELALAGSAHLVCSSYVSPALAAHGKRAAELGTVLLTETGLDPGIDHLLAHQLVRAARQVTGDRPASVRFGSYCGSNPAVPNDFRYRFSWAPRGVLTALLTPARLIEDGVPRTVDRAWEAVTSHTVAGETFEVYPNRDSLPFIATYGLPATWRLESFVRGTLRLDGWHEAWKPVFAELAEADEAGVTALAERLVAQHPTAEGDRDRVVMAVRLELRTDDGQPWAGEWTIDAVGDARESATSRLVSVPLAGGVLEVAAGRVPPGLHQATDDPEAVPRWLAFLAEHGITATFHGDGGA